MRHFSESGKRVKRLREARKQTQAEFARSLDLSQGTISTWEKGREKPSPFGYFQMALMASGPKLDLPAGESAWFMRRAGDYEGLMMTYAGTVLKERGLMPLAGEVFRVPCVRKSAQGTKSNAQSLLWPSKILPNPASTRCLIVGDAVINDMFLPGDMIVLETSDNLAADLTPLWNQVVLLDIDSSRGRLVDPQFTWGKWPQGLCMGRLRFKRFKVPEIRQEVYPAGSRLHTAFFFWVATLGPLADCETMWEPGDKGIYIGHWRANLTQNVGSLEEVVAFEAEAERQAPNKIRIEEACRILGRVIGWIRPPGKAE